MEELKAQVKILADHFDELRESHRELAGSVRTLTQALTTNTEVTQKLNDSIVGTTERPGLAEQVRKNTSDISGIKTRSWAIVMLAIAGFFSAAWKWIIDRH